ncbi:hypothetical protein HMPREF0972_00135 [Actinomyces sp. oral taxon 848 str. F0332]|nr:hypothetical protein HMPREF0972_00135 [Actinomyces sp. oral taxon 848 str. F0332]
MSGSRSVASGSRSVASSSQSVTLSNCGRSTGRNDVVEVHSLGNPSSIECCVLKESVIGDETRCR